MADTTDVTNCVGKITLAQSKRLFSIDHKNLASRKVVGEKINGSPAFDLDEYFAKCGDLVAKRYAERAMAATGQTLEELKAEETQERIRKLRIENDEKEGSLVDAGQVIKTYMDGLRIYADTLDGIIPAIKMAHPTIDQAILDMVNKALIEGRNKCAAFSFD